jgi:hypothetical protein
MAHRRNATALCIAVAIGLSAAQPVCSLADFQCPDLEPTAGEYGYKIRGDGRDRCEGMYVAPNAGSVLEVISLYHEPMPVGREDVVLTVSPPPLGRFASEVVKIRAVAKDVRTYYRMDAELKPKGILRWPVDDVLLPSGLVPDGFGVHGWIDDEEEGRLFIPLRIGVESEPPSKPAGVVLLVRTSVRLDELRWRVRVPGALTPPNWSSSHYSLIAGQTFEIDLPARATTDAVQKVVVDVAGREKSTWHPILVVSLLQGGSGDGQ